MDDQQLIETLPEAFHGERVDRVVSAMTGLSRARAKQLIAEGKVKARDFPDFATETGFKPPQTEFIDNVTYDGTKPNAYIDSFKIGLKNGDKL